MFGTGKTAVKATSADTLKPPRTAGSLSRETDGRLQTTTTRSWTDQNKNFVADCDLSNGAAQDRRATGGDFCGAYTTADFGTKVFDTTQDPTLMSGWGIRSGDWQMGASVEQQLLPRVSVELGYQRRWLVNFIVTDSLNRAPEDHAQFGINVPADSRLPTGGGYVLGGLYNVSAAAAAKGSNNFVTLINGGDQTQVANSVNMKVVVRARNGLSLQGGFNTANTHSDYCAERAAVPEWTVVGAQSPTNPWCDGQPDGSRASPRSGHTTFQRLTSRFRGQCEATREANWRPTGPRPTRRPWGSTGRSRAREVRL